MELLCGSSSSEAEFDLMPLVLLLINFNSFLYSVDEIGSKYVL